MIEDFNFNGFVFVDTETGGLDSYKHSLLSVGMVSGDGADSMEFYVKEAETLRVEQSALDINHIDVNLVLRTGLTPDQSIEKIDNFMNSCKDKNNGKYPTIVGHNVAFDLGFLKKLWSVSGRQIPRYFHRTMDTGTMLQFLNLLGKAPSDAARSDVAFKLYEVNVEKSLRHTALGDTTATRELFFKIVLSELAKNTVQTGSSSRLLLPSSR